MRVKEKYFVTYCHNVQIDWFGAFAIYLKEKLNIQSLCIVQGEVDYRHAINNDSYDVVIDVLTDFNIERAKEDLDINLARLNKWETNNNETNFFRDLFQDRWLMGKYEYEYIVHFGVHIIDMLSKILDEYPPLVSVGEKNSLPYRIFHHYSRMRDFPHYTHLSTRSYPLQKFFFEPDVFWRWPKIVKFYNEYKESGVPKKYIEIAEKKLNEIVNDHLNSEKKLVKRGEENILNKIKRRHLRRLMFDIFPNRKKRDLNPRIDKVDSVIQLFRNYLKRRKDQRLFDSVVLSDFDLKRKFCTYFLHLQPEYTIDGLGFSVNNQVELIRTIAASIPADHVLLVKEHRVAVGKRSEGFYQSILALPNVFLISDHYDGHILIKNSSVVFTITGSVALEAMHHQKPAIAFGEIFYQAFDGITSCKDMRELSTIIREMIKCPSRYIADKANSLAVLAAMWHAGHYGCLNPIFINSKDIPKSPNKENIGAALIRELKYEGRI